MRLTHTFTVPVPVDEAFVVLQDIERIAPCMPGATLEGVDGDQFTGTVKVKVGPIAVQYRGTGRFVEVDSGQYTSTIEASGNETRGGGTAKATIRATLHERGDHETAVDIVSDVMVTGRVAQFGRGVMDDVGAKLLDKFAECLSEELGRQDEPAPAPEPDASGPEATGADASGPEITGADASGPDVSGPQIEPAPPAAPSAPAQTRASTAVTAPRARPTEDAIDLLDVAGTPVLKRALPLVAAALVVAAVVLWPRIRR